MQEVVAKAALDAHVEELCEKVARLAPLSHRATKLSVDELSRPHLSDAATSARRACYDSADYREGVQAFLDKRHAVFEGR